ncbi:MAG: hypothetical protein HYR60_13340 [Acidobacteria bacterium]|nr:hypothetical protein [Acidobacteriota bacterium]
MQRRLFLRHYGFVEGSFRVPDSETLYPILLRPCTVRILMVTDSGGDGGHAAFSFGDMLNTFPMSPPWMRFAVTKADRSANPHADLQNFRFDGVDLSQYDQVWLYRMNGSGTPLSDAELGTVTQFMDGAQDLQFG